MSRPFFLLSLTALMVSACAWDKPRGLWRMTLLSDPYDALEWPEPEGDIHYEEADTYTAYEGEDIDNFGYATYADNVWVFPGESKETEGGCTTRRGTEMILDLDDSRGRHKAAGELRIQRWVVAGNGCGHPFETVSDKRYEAEGRAERYPSEEYERPSIGYLHLAVQGIGGLRCQWPPDPGLDRHDLEPEWDGVFEIASNIDDQSKVREAIECRVTGQYIIFRELEEEELPDLLYRP